jgi:hypothetical protein
MDVHEFGEKGKILGNGVIVHAPNVNACPGLHGFTQMKLNHESTNGLLKNLITGEFS